MTLRPIIILFGLFVAACTSTSAQPQPAVSPLAICPDEAIAEALSTLGDYTPSDIEDFIYLENDRLMLNGAPYVVQGANYYPANSPWRRFLTETDLTELRQELNLIREAGFNTLRIFLWNQALFNCPGSGAVPNWGTFQRLDGIIRAAARADFRLIVTLNDLPDLTDYPLYDNPLHIQQQTAFIIDRYRDEPAILAWDLRNEGDIDYGVNPHFEALFEPEHVLRWLQATYSLVKEMGTPHLITAGWFSDAGATADYVDFISFHHWTDSTDLLQKIVTLRAETSKPILLQEFGYSTYEANITPQFQAQIISEIVEVSRNEDLLGWMIWTAFDFPQEATCFPSPCRSQDNPQHHFGIWQSDYTPKPAAVMLSELMAQPAD